MDLGQLYYVARKLRSWVEQTIIPDAISKQFPFYHWIILRDLVETPNTTIQEISQRLSLAQSMVSSAVSRLKAQGYIITEPDPNDRRKTRLYPSKEIAEWVLKRIHQDAETAFGLLMKDRTPEERASVIQALALLYKQFKSLEESKLE
jgi:DNA-binding MarR family transcriptional regulator